MVTETSGFLFLSTAATKRNKTGIFWRRCLIFLITKITKQTRVLFFFCFVFGDGGWHFVASDGPHFATFGQINIKSTLRCLWPPLTKLKRKKTTIGR